MFNSHVLGITDADSEEFNAEAPTKAVVYMPEISKTHLGGTMRLGMYFYTTILCSLSLSLSGWLAGWLAGWLVVWLAGCLAVLFLSLRLCD
jgi:hypothetical protein